MAKATSQLALVVSASDDGGRTRAEWLRSAGFSVVQAATARQTLPLAEHRRPDIIVLDAELPDGSGPDVCRRLKNQQATAGIAVLLVAPAAGWPPGLEEVADGFLVEPVHPGVLVAFVRSLLRERASRDDLDRSRKELLLCRGLPVRDGAGRILNRYGAAAGIGDHRAAEQALEKSRARLGQVVHTSVIGVAFADAAGRIVDCNKAFADLAAYDCRAMIESGINWDDLTPEEDRGADREAFGSVRRGATPEPYEKRILRSDGAMVPVLANVAALPGEPGKTVTLALDITEQKRSQEAVRQSEERLKLAQEAGNTGAWDWNPAENELVLSEQALRIFGLPRAPSKGALEACLARLHPDDRERVAEEFKAAAGEGELRTEFRTLSDGNICWLALAGRAVARERGRWSRISGVVTDVTERRVAAQRVVEWKDRYEAAVRATGQMLYDWDLADGRRTWAGAAESVLGYSIEELGRDLHEWVALIHPEDRAQFKSGTATVAESGAPTRLRYRVRHKSGDYVEVEDRGDFIRDSTGRPVRAVGFVLDVSERARFEEELLALNEALRRSNEELQQFAFVVSHDLQEPLRVIRGMAELIRKRYSGSFGPDGDELIGHMVNSSQRMQALIEDLLAYSRVGDQRSVPAPVDLNGVLMWAMGNLAKAIEESHAAITCDPLPLVEGDFSRLSQLFQNLLSNAIKYRGERPVRIHVSAEAAGKDWVIRVKDNGIGIDSRYRERIFGVFKRLHGREVPGTGLGLAICRRIVEKSGGRIWVESTPGEGSEFCFTLPAAAGSGVRSGAAG